MPEPTLELEQQIAAAATAQGVDPALLMAIVEEESGFDPAALGDWEERAMLPELFVGYERVQPDGTIEVPMSYGLGQLHLRGAGAGFQPAELLDVETNLRVSAAYLKACLELFPGNIALVVSAYNQGIPGAEARGWTQVNAVAVAKYLRSYQRWTRLLMQYGALPHIDAAWGYLSHRPYSPRRARDEVLEVKSALGLG